MSPALLIPKYVMYFEVVIGWFWKVLYDGKDIEGIRLERYFNLLYFSL